MTLEIRPAKAEEMEEYRRLMAASYLPSPDDQPNIEVRPEWSLCAFEDGKLAATYGSWPLVMRFNDAGVPVAGITNVSTLPIHRRKGYLRKITEEHFKIIHDIGEWSIAALWAAHAAIYQRYGYGIVSTRNEYRIEPRYLQFAASEPVRGTYREIEKDESEVVVDIYRRFGAERTGYLERAPVVWDIGLLGVPP
ncbi:MAG: GNAT family N-acetyltransferase, partial [Proteobacteria bacterium]|nr:GNAT family N-acetyltransferase [Pseudomonadota bacterium]